MRAVIRALVVLWVACPGLVFAQGADPLAPVVEYVSTQMPLVAADVIAVGCLVIVVIAVLRGIAWIMAMLRSDATDDGSCGPFHHDYGPWDIK